MRTETMVILLKSYYNSLPFIGEESKDKTLIKINELEQEFWFRTGLEFRVKYGIEGVAI